MDTIVDSLENEFADILIVKSYSMTLKAEKKIGYYTMCYIISVGFFLSMFKIIKSIVVISKNRKLYALEV